MGEPATEPKARLSPRVPAIAVAIGVITMVVAVLVILNLGGPVSTGERRGDVTYIGGTATKRPRGEAQLAASIADLISADVVAVDPAALVFTTWVASSAPRSLKSSALEFRWGIAGGDGSDWTLAVTIRKDVQAALFADTGYGVATIDDTFPGQLTIEDDMIEVRLDMSEIDDFPSNFAWSLSTTLRAFRSESDSPRVEDRFPDEGQERFEL